MSPPHGMCPSEVADIAASPTGPSAASGVQLGWLPANLISQQRFQVGHATTSSGLGTCFWLTALLACGREGGACVLQASQGQGQPLQSHVRGGCSPPGSWILAVR